MGNFSEQNWGDSAERRHRQTFELYGHRITHINNRDVQQLLAAAHTDRIRPLCLSCSWDVTVAEEEAKADRETAWADYERCGSYE